MSKNDDDPPGRTEKLIPLVRQTFGDDHDDLRRLQRLVRCYGSHPHR